MASLISTTKFQPFSFERYMQPIQVYANLYERQEAALDALDEQASQWEKLADMAGSEKAYNRYKAYSNELSSMAENLSKNGLTPESRRALRTMKSRYAKEIAPIENAYRKREQDIELERQARLKDPTFLMEGSAATTGIDAYLENPNIRADKTGYSGAMITKQVSDLAQYLGQQLTQFKTTGNLDPYTKTLMKKWGMEPSDVLSYLQNPTAQNPVFDALVGTVLGSTGISEWKDNDAKSRALYYARQGIVPAIGKSDATTYEDFGSRKGLEFQQAVEMENLRYAHDIAKQEQAARIANMGNGEDSFFTISDVEGGDTNMSDLEKDLKWLEDIEKRGGWKETAVKKEMQGTYSRQDATGANQRTGKDPYINLINGGTRAEANNSDAVYANNYRRIAERYGIDGSKYNKETLAKLKQMVEREYNNGIVRNNTYKMNITDSSGIAQILYENSQTAYNNRGNRTGFTNYEKGKLKKPLSASEVANIADKGDDFSFDYRPKVGFVLNYRIDGKTKAAVIDPSILGYGDRYSSMITGNERGHAYINYLLESGRTEEAAEEINNMMNDLYYRFNTRRVKQSNTGEVE